MYDVFIILRKEQRNFVSITTNFGRHLSRLMVDFRIPAISGGCLLSLLSIDMFVLHSSLADNWWDMHDFDTGFDFYRTEDQKAAIKHHSTTTVVPYTQIHELCMLLSITGLRFPLLPVPAEFGMSLLDVNISWNSPSSLVLQSKYMKNLLCFPFWMSVLHLDGFHPTIYTEVSSYLGHNEPTAEKLCYQDTREWDVRNNLISITTVRSLARRKQDI